MSLQEFSNRLSNFSVDCEEWSMRCQVYGQIGSMVIGLMPIMSVACGPLNAGLHAEQFRIVC